ncbi:MAG TPA: DEAD/DEAH box helicase family protein [Chthonomonadales bacterium]|nr:DEAD/DEAH box helicase family protein [Chthonomonadales bacterium]
MNRHVSAIAGRLSLRPPQRDSLEVLARVADIIDLRKGSDLTQALDLVRCEFPSVTSFERDFPSLCFALATGVGKTRLMGAFIAYLNLARGIRNFFVLAPNLTIYNKLVADFTPNTPKYVFQGIGEFAARPPEIITGDTYESGRGVRQPTLELPGFEDDRVHANIFNISKINTEVRGGASPRIKRLSEYIGQSYFDYLAALPDLVLLMDESHRYRASAGVRALNELGPVLGLELTATPFIEEAGGQRWFKNTIYAYPLPRAMEDGFTKEPTVATRAEFDPSSCPEDELERIKLEDGVRIHEETKVELEVYARQNDRPVVKPFMLVVAQDVQHANRIVARIKEDDFFEGRYRERVITVHSNQRGEERDETVQQLLSVENPDNPTEIVVHVNMLKEGWDVTNLYTIVPLRAARSRTLVEQCVGRGLRLPFGKRTGVPPVDRLTIVAHDMFQALIDEANDPESIIRKGVVIGRDVAVERKQSVTVQPLVAALLTGEPEPGAARAPAPFATRAEREVARTALEVMKRFEKLPRSADLTSSSTQADIVREVRALYATDEPALVGTTEEPDVEAVVAKATALYVDRSIDIPRIVVVPKGAVTSGYHDFDLDTRGVRLQPVSKEILLHYLRTHERTRILTAAGLGKEARLEDYLVRGLIDYADISYDEQAELLYKLAGQMVAHLESYLAGEHEVENVLQYHQRALADLIHAQMQAHHWENAVGYEAVVSKGFTTLRPCSFTAVAGEAALDFRQPVPPGRDIRALLFGGFSRCLYPVQKFDSEPERQFAVLLEDEPGDLKWFKPGTGQFQIEYSHGQMYEPDFVVETASRKYLCEPKRASELADAEVQAKARAAALWCERATEHELKHGGKPWSYLLIPHDRIAPNRSLASLANEFTFQQ